VAVTAELAVELDHVRTRLDRFRKR